MSTASEQFTQGIQEAYDLFEKELNGQKDHWLTEKRRAAIGTAINQHFPYRKDEEWKYTHFEKVLKQGFVPGASIATTHGAKKEDLQDYAEASYKVVLVNGVYNEALSTIPKGVELQRNTEASEEFRESFHSIADDSHLFANLNGGFWQEALFIKASQAIEEHLHIIYLTDTTEGTTFYHPRVFVRMEANAELKMSEVYLSKGEHPGWHNAILEAELEENAKLNYTLIQSDASHVHHTGIAQAKVKRYANFTANTLTLNGGMVRNDLNIDLEDSNTEGHMFGLYLTRDKMHVDNHTAVDHKEAQAYSNELYKGILNDKSTGVFNGKIFVRQDAQQTNAFQSNNNILLSDSATINTKPQLEIWADDVQCSHGATTGRLEKESLFYLQSRGLSKENARRLLIRAFAGEIIEKVPHELDRSFIEAVLEERF